MDQQTTSMRELLEAHRELIEEKISSLKQDVYTFRKQVLGNGQPGDIDRIRGVITGVGGKCDSRNSEIWKALDEVRADRAERSDVYNLQAKVEELERALQKKGSAADVEDLKKQRWIWAGALGALAIILKLYPILFKAG